MWVFIAGHRIVLVLGDSARSSEVYDKQSATLEWEEKRNAPLDYRTYRQRSLQAYPLSTAPRPQDPPISSAEGHII